MTVKEATKGLLPPQNLDAERAVLGAMLLHRNALLIGLEQLKSRDFYRPEHGRIFQAMTNLFNRDSAVDLVTVTDELRRMNQLELVGGESGVSAVCESVASVANAEHYCRIVQDKSLMRQMIDTCSEVVQECFQGDEGARDLLNTAQSKIFELSRISGKKSFVSLRDVLPNTFKTIQDFHINKVHITGIPSGFNDLDNLTAGFQKGDLVIIAGRPSMGKTAIMLNMAEFVAVDPRGPKRPVAIFSLEMSTESLVLRLLCSHARIDAQRMRTGYLKAEEWKELVRRAGDLDNSRIFIDDSGSSNIMEIRTKARRLKMEHPELSMVVVDYLQLVGGMPGSESRQQEISQVSRALKALAKELELPVIALSQLSRAVESRGGSGRPMLSDLRECVTGDTPVCLSDGRRVPIQDLVGTTPRVWSMSGEGKIVAAESDLVWKVGTRPILRIRLASGRSIRCTADHRLFGNSGWARAGTLERGSRLAMARRLPEPEDARELLEVLSGGSSHFSFSPSRATVAQYAELLEDPELKRQAESELFWDSVISIEDAGTEDVYDLTVPGNANWLADGIVSHNSGAIEQDADAVMFVYRPAYYKAPEQRTPEEMAKAEIILAKQRNGPTGNVPLVFLSEYTRFETAARPGDEEFT